jgi:hypothetical protein
VLLPEPIAPVGTFQHAYVDLGDALTDAAHDYQLGFGHLALAAALGGRRWLRNYSGRRLNPNLYVMALGGSGVDRKSTTLNIARDRVEASAPDALGADETTREKFIESIAQRPWQTLFISEYGAWDRAMGRDYNAGAQELFTHLWDGVPRYLRERMAGSHTATAPIVSIGACSTQEWFERAVSDADVGAGRWGRWIYLRPIARPPRRHEVGTWPAQLIEAIDRVLKHAHSLTEAEMTLSDGAKALLRLWQIEHEQVLERGLSAQVAALYSRLGDYARKFAILYQVGFDLPKGIDPRTIDARAASAAIAYVDRLRGGLAELFEEELATTVYGRAMRRVREVIGTNGGVDQWTLTRRTQNIDRSLRERILADLVDSGRYEKVSVVTPGRPKHLWRQSPAVTKV